MYTIMNKDVPLIDFHWERDVFTGWREHIDKVYLQPWFIRDFHTWLEYRSITKHREHMDTLLSSLGLRDTKGIIDFSKGLSLTDTLWVNQDDKYTWDKVNLFDNEFDEVIEKIAFDGGMYGQHFSTTSPEFGTNGTYAKCWHREEDGKIYLYKQGSFGAANAGKEVYSEMYASQILDVLGYDHARYDVIKYRGHLVSRCELFTSRSEMLLPAEVFADDNRFEFGNLVNICKENGMLTQLSEYLITDAIILNEDRHFGNFGVICDADTFEIKRMAPIYDNGVSLLCYYHVDPRYPASNPGTMFEYAATRSPRLYRDFISGAKEIATSEQLSHLKVLNGFKFDTSGNYNLPKDRVEQLEEIVQIQVDHLLNEAKNCNSRWD